MKKKFFYLLLAAVTTMGFASSCSDDDDNDIPSDNIPEAVTKAFRQQYPDAKNVEWSQNGKYYVADFDEATRFTDIDAWYTAAGEWAMSENDYGKDLFLIPAAVNAGFNKTDYRTWTVDDIDYYEFPAATRDFYVIEVETAGQPDTDLYFRPDGTLVKAVTNDTSVITPDTVI